ncbi:hypothetical protein H0H81_012077 [Sphagnurus paluster]|uniref:SMP-LTD domain-containing protein n=1 Tax=Sphagnurus paluster TaxID=117069 RepID=A0A9P7KFN0_9AGAR|nr:hypothetical protein H0H81_012077 [Sphagnurus paluster]
MTLKALFYAYILGGITFIPLVLAGIVFYTLYTSVPLEHEELAKKSKARLHAEPAEASDSTSDAEETPAIETNDMPRTRKGWLTMRRTFEESTLDGGYVSVVRSFLDARSKDPKRSRPKDMWYVVLKGKVLYLYEDEEMTECEAVVELGGHDVVVYPEGLLDGELFARRNAICLKPKQRDAGRPNGDYVEGSADQRAKRQDKEQDRLGDAEKVKHAAKEDIAPWFMFVRSNIEMEDWYFALIHASDHPAKTPSLAPLQPIFLPTDMNHLVSTLDEQPDVIPTRWLNALIGRIFFSYYRTHNLEAYIIGRLMKKLSKVKRPTFLTDIVVTEVSVGNKAPTLSKPMLKELTKEGDAAIEVHFQYKGEFRITIEATANIALGTFKSYTVKLVLAAVLKELEGNLLIKIKRPPSNRIWYAFTQSPRMVLEVEPIVSDRQITWGMITSTIESRLKEIIQESVVMPNMDDIAFFDSYDYQHRGGIWQDASRQERPAASLDHLAASDDAQSTVSAPVPDSAPTVLPQGPMEPISQSAEELVAPAPSSVRSPSPIPAAEDETSDTHRNPQRRRSWFSSARSEGSSSQKGALDDDFEHEMHRGRSTRSEKSGGSKDTSRSRSSPQNQETAGPNHSDHIPEGDDSSLLSTFLLPQSVRRSSSQHSNKRDHTKSVSSDSSTSAPDSNPTTPRKTSGTSTTQASPNSSFLSTLKSRAGDKQALSTAKEAMRKWGVNWGIRKDSTDASDHSSIGSTISSRLRPETNFGVATKARASYAEVRAAVAERKGRGAGGERHSGLTDDGTDLSRSSSPSIPVPVPSTSRGKERAVSSPWSGYDLTPPFEESTLGPSSYPKSVALSTSANSATSSSSKRLSAGAPSISRTNTEGDGAVPMPSKPIHVSQPTAKTMTIPGIHASHRGDIMSMGYAPPPQPPSMAPSEGKSSSIYRLFKTSSTSDDQQPPSFIPSSSSSSSQPPHDHASIHAAAAVAGDAASRDVAPLAAASSTSVNPNLMTASAATTASPPHQPLPASTSTRIPPPLPPRSTPISQPQPRPHPQPVDITAIPSAEETLKSIVTKDERIRRASTEGMNGSGNPHTEGAGATGPSTLEDGGGSVSANTVPPSEFDQPSDSASSPLPSTRPTAPSSTPNPNPGPPLPPRRPAQAQA